MFGRTTLIAISCIASAGCAAASSTDASSGAPFDAGSRDGSASDDGGSLQPDDSGFSAETAPEETGSGGGASLIYATTNTALWSMDPATKKVTQIGPFDFGSATAENITDVAVDKDGKVYVNSETTIYTATLPASGTGSVVLTKKLGVGTGSKFYALGMAPEGVLETGEALVGGDSLGDLYWIPSTGGAPQKLGGFGTWAAGDPPGGKTGDVWELSGDVVFFSIGGSPRGLATLRPCSTSGSCRNGNDVVAEIDMTELAKKSPTAKLRKAFLGSGSGYGRLFGIGAWDSEVYAFSLVTKGTTSTPAQLVAIDSSGTGTLLQSFPMISDGWTGAGVTTKAKVSVIK